LFQIIPLISLVATFTTGWVARRVAPYTLAAVGYVWIILAGLAVWSGAGWMIYLLAFGLGIVPAACFAAIPSLNPSASDRSRAAGALSQMGNIGTTLGTPVFAFTMLSAGMSGLWVVIMGACAIGLGLIYWMTAKIVAPQN
jgi:predicted MFS family arabinose efflux permease